MEGLEFGTILGASEIDALFGDTPDINTEKQQETPPPANKEEETKLILERLRLPSSSKVAIDVYPIGAKEFMLNELNVKKMAKYVPEEEGLPF